MIFFITKTLGYLKIILITTHLRSGNLLSIFKVLHIHVFHGDDMFSKFQFKAGNYDKLAYPNAVNATLIKYYALKMALEGKKTEPKDLVMQLKTEIDKKI
jgi:hypothetical protein